MRFGRCVTASLTSAAYFLAFVACDASDRKGPGTSRATAGPGETISQGLSGGGEKICEFFLFIMSNSGVL